MSTQVEQCEWDEMFTAHRARDDSGFRRRACAHRVKILEFWTRQHQEFKAYRLVRGDARKRAFRR